MNAKTIFLLIVIFALAVLALAYRNDARMPTSERQQAVQEQYDRCIASGQDQIYCGRQAAGYYP